VADFQQGPIHKGASPITSQGSFIYGDRKHGIRQKGYYEAKSIEEAQEKLLQFFSVQGSRMRITKRDDIPWYLLAPKPVFLMALQQGFYGSMSTNGGVDHSMKSLQSANGGWMPADNKQQCTLFEHIYALQPISEVDFLAYWREERRVMDVALALKHHGIFEDMRKLILHVTGRTAEGIKDSDEYRFCRHYLIAIHGIARVAAEMKKRLAAPEGGGGSQAAGEENKFQESKLGKMVFGEKASTQAAAPPAPPKTFKEEKQNLMENKVKSEGGVSQSGPLLRVESTIADHLSGVRSLESFDAHTMEFNYPEMDGYDIKEETVSVQEAVWPSGTRPSVSARLSTRRLDGSMPKMRNWNARLTALPTSSGRLRTQRCAGSGALPSRHNTWWSVCSSGELPLLWGAGLVTSLAWRTTRRTQASWVTTGASTMSSSAFT
jgi:hypothetical protein